MTGPPVVPSIPDPVSRSSRLQLRASRRGQRVPVVGADGTLIDLCPSERLSRYATAANAQIKRRHDGSIKLVRLGSVGDDRGHLGENHGRSTITTERVRNDLGELIGSNLTLKHKETSSSWRRLLLPVGRR